MCYQVSEEAVMKKWKLVFVYLDTERRRQELNEQAIEQAATTNQPLYLVFPLPNSTLDPLNLPTFLDSTHEIVVVTNANINTFAETEHGIEYIPNRDNSDREEADVAAVLAVEDDMDDGESQGMDLDMEMGRVEI